MNRQAKGSEREVPTVTMAEALRYTVRVAKLVRPYWELIAKSSAMGIGLGMVGMVLPYLSKLYFDRVYPSHDISLLRVLVIGTLVLTATTGVLTAIKGYYSTIVSAQMNRAVSLMFFNHIQHLPVRFFDEHRVGDVTSRFDNVRTSIQFVSSLFDTMILNGIYLLLVPPLLLFINAKLALLSLVTVPLTTTIATVSSRWVRRYSKQAMEISATLSSFQIEALTHIRNTKGMAGEHFVFRTANRHLHDAMEVQLKTSLLSVAIGFTNTLSRAVGQAVFSYIAWQEIVGAGMTLGEFVAFTAYIGYLSGPVGAFASLFSSLQTSSVSLARMFEFLDLPVEQDPALAFREPPPIRHYLSGAIVVDRVGFGYSEDKLVLGDVTLRFEAGSVNAIVGPSGAGKSSLLRLLCRLEAIDAGHIRIGGLDIEEISLADLRRQVAFVSQEYPLVRGTVLHNLTYGLGEIPRARIDEATRICRLDEVIANLPSGIDSTVAEWGASLSGGQRQRLAIARALIRDTPILLLDEVTANIDVTTENQILRDLFSSVTGKTVIYVTHRINSATLAANIVVLNNGGVAGVGSHSELMEQCALYRELHSAAASNGDDLRRLRVVGREVPITAR